MERTGPRRAVSDFAPRVRSVRLTGWQLTFARGGVVVAMIVLWQVCAAVFGTVDYTSGPLQVVRQLGEWESAGVLWEATGVTLAETAIGFVIGAATGGVAGLVLGWSRQVGRVIEPVVVLLYAVPKLAIAPLFVLWFGIGISSKALFAALVVFFLVFFTAFQGARQVDRELLAVARVMGAGGRDVWLKVAIPQATLWIFAGLRLALPYALIGAVVAEFLAARTGLGYLIRSSSSVFNSAGVYAGIVLLMFFATVLLAVMQAIERRVMHWNTSPTVDADGVV